MWGECACCLTVQPDVHPLGELGQWCDTCANETGGCLHAAMDDVLDKEMLRLAGRSSSGVSWHLSDQLHKRLGSVVRNNDHAWVAKAEPIVTWLTNDAQPMEPIETLEQARILAAAGVPML